MMPSDITSYAASEDLYQRATAGWDAHSFGPLIAMHAVEEPNQVDSCTFEDPAMPAVTYSSPLHNLDERRWQQSVFTGKILSKVDGGAWKDRLCSRKRNTFLEERAARKAHKTAFRSLKHAQCSGQYVRGISASNDPYSLVSRLLHEKSPAYNSSKEESASSQYAKEIRPGNDPSLLISRLLHEEIPGRNSLNENSASTQYAREICASNYDPSLLLSRLLHEESPACSFKDDSASTQYARELCGINDPSLPLSRLLHEESPWCNSFKEDSASNLYAEEICPSNDPSLLLSDRLQEGSPGCNSSKEDSASIQHAKDICPSNDPSLLLSSLLINAETSGCSSSEKGSKSELYSHFENLSLNKCSRTQLGSSSTQCESSVSERWNEKFTKVAKESTMQCSETISSCADQSQQSSGVELRNVDCAPTYLLPAGEREELVVIEDYITSRDWSLNTEIGVQVEETIHDEFSGNRAVLKSKATDELLDDWLIL
ncbi:hypothetical protein O6H91_Y266100 [Diphasiastrum complanatum]|nr:hypothetical protein O6H91_Y266100 [Diphasiastrum complanatum]